MCAYRFNSLSGKIVTGAAQRVGQAIKSSVPDSPQIIWETKKVKFPSATVQTVKATKPGFGEVPASLRAKYKKFQKDDGTPIHLKGGPVDVGMYYATLIGCAIGVEECFRYYYETAFPKKV